MTNGLGLVLSGGFLRGAFQVGVIEALHARGLGFGLVAGVSSGAWNAACVATGQIQEMREFWLAVARAPKLRWQNIRRYGTPSNFPEIVRSVPMRRLCFDSLDRSGVQLRIAATSIRERRLRWFETWSSRDAFFDALMASNYVPGLYGAPICIDGRYYADGSLVDNVPYEVALEAGCERVLVIVSDWRGDIRKKLIGRAPHEVPVASRKRLVVIHPDAPLPIGRLVATPDAVLGCIRAGHRAAEQALREQSDWEGVPSDHIPTKEMEL